MKQIVEREGGRLIFAGQVKGLFLGEVEEQMVDVLRLSTLRFLTQNKTE